MSENNNLPICKGCGTEMELRYRSGLPVWYCPAPEELCYRAANAALRSENKALRDSVSAIEFRAQELEQKLRAAEDAVVVLHRRCETVIPVLDEAMNLLSWLKHDLYGTGKGDYNGKIPCCQEDGEQQLVQLRVTLADTARFAAQRKREIVREALEQAWGRYAAITLWTSAEDREKDRAAILNPTEPA